MSHVFISYSRADYDRAKNLADALRESRVPVWWDPQITLGEQWQPALEEAIYGAAAVVVLWSQDSIGSEWVYREANLASQQGTLVPALIDQVTPPGEFAQYDCADLRNWNPRRPHREFDQLRRHLLGLFGTEGNWEVTRLDQETLLVQLDNDQHTVSYNGGHLYVNGEMVVQGSASVIDTRNFDFWLSDSGNEYQAHLTVVVSMLRGKVKRLTLTIGGSTLYDD